MAKKKVTKGKKKSKSTSELATKTITPEQVTLPPITNVRCATLQAAVINEDVSSLQRLVSHYDYEKDLTAVDINGSTLIHTAIRKQDPVMLDRLISFQRININALESSTVGGWSAVHVACQIDFRQGLDILLRARAHPNIKADSSCGETPLMICCKLGRIECGKMLLAAGASMSTNDNFGNNASFWAYKYHQDQLIRELNLPPVHTATADEFVALLLKKNPRFVLPTLKKPKKKKGGKDKDGKKKKK
jgi:ankyrin repeat protein